MAGAASFAVRSIYFHNIFISLIFVLQAAKAYEEYRLRHGKPVSHARAKELVYVLFC
jgi:hypothetical protein